METFHGLGSGIGVAEKGSGVVHEFLFQIVHLNLLETVFAEIIAFRAEKLNFFLTSLQVFIKVFRFNMFLINLLLQLFNSFLLFLILFLNISDLCQIINFLFF